MRFPNAEEQKGYRCATIPQGSLQVPTVSRARLLRKNSETLVSQIVFGEAVLEANTSFADLADVPKVTNNLVTTIWPQNRKV
ncbi:hypothetical protein [Sphingomonas arenae]|uniref:hypothetical protein n=1 Tax=Sphingomonas arenae TaxID=2812555 RepID=UPI0019688075|nr:hypothetical protein [Sphingomonas arenae]